MTFFKGTRFRVASSWAAACLTVSLLATAFATPSRAAEEPPAFQPLVESGELPPLQERLPSQPSVDLLDRDWQSPGNYGGRMTLLMAKARDLRQIVVYGYARLMGYTPDLQLRPDLLAGVDVEDDRIFTLQLRPGHRWSDGHPFTTEDFRYWWEDVANNEELSPAGPPIALAVDGELPSIEILDETSIRFTWSRPNPTFLHKLAGARPLFLYAPAHYLKQFHERYADAEALQAMADEARARNWAALHNRKDDLYKLSNVDLPTLDPWVLQTAPPSERFVFARNPYFHRVDPEGRQLPYIDKVVVQLAATGIIPAKTGAGESDLQARYIRFDNYTFLKAAEKRLPLEVRLWQTAQGARLALFPNLNVDDPVLRKLFRDVRFRRALSLAVNRHEINQVVYFGLGVEGNNTVLPGGPLYREDYRRRWAEFDLAQANALLDEIGLTERDDDGVRLLSDGRPLELIVESAGESTEETDVLQLIRDSWAQAGIALYSKPSQREIFRNRVFAGETQIAIASGMENGVPTAVMSPARLAPTSQNSLQWPRWGQYVETRGGAGEPADLPAAEELMSLFERWEASGNADAKAGIWHEMLEIHADQVFTIGLIAGIPQPIVVADRLKNLPTEGLFNWEPGAFFGIYRPDTWWLDLAADQ